MLELRRVTTGYGTGAVVHQADLTVGAGEIVALIGANGAGKSTLLKAVSGLLGVRSGEILFDGERIEKLAPRQRVQRGLVHVPEGRQVFAGLSIEENLWLGGNANRRLGEQEASRRLAEMCVRFPVLGERRHEPAGNLSGGQQQMLAIARGLMSQPRLLLLDEPSLGLSPLLVTEIFRLVAGLRAQGMAILLSEQNARQSLAIADRAYVLEAGCIVLEGSGEALLGDRQVAERYLGVGKAVDAPDERYATQLAARLGQILQS
ncbi:high-affinity branched-chain amino acid transport ATP-binding protein LivF [mine drainage metagenome]|uniref:High-affinity branched-chain amino acid transport ATP-binding protein LivF n=1 Tax=mine drainage metagenome TaxID=410659 RepID=A0A1J5SAH9_9ZZZZ